MQLQYMHSCTFCMGNSDFRGNIRLDLDPLWLPCRSKKSVQIQIHLNLTKFLVSYPISYVWWIWLLVALVMVPSMHQWQYLPKMGLAPISLLAGALLWATTAIGGWSYNYGWVCTIIMTSMIIVMIIPYYSLLSQLLSW